MPNQIGSIILMIALIAVSPARADDSGMTAPILDRVVAEGYEVYDVTRTWLGRVLITAKNKTFLREIVLNRTTGEVLRDKLFRLSPGEKNGTAQPHSGASEPPGAPSNAKGNGVAQP